MLEHVADSGAQVPAFKGATRVADVAANRGYRGSVVLADDHGQPAGERGLGQPFAKILF